MKTLKGMWLRLKLLYALWRVIRVTNKWVDALKKEELREAASLKEQP